MYICIYVDRDSDATRAPGARTPFLMYIYIHIYIYIYIYIYIDRDSDAKRVYI
jgi:hypothetical protein